ncbi:MAG: Gfo/Idh/MocA family oxidoreductase [Ignavibacteriaceae bacterium]
MKFVIIGTGNISSTYINALNNIPEAELIGFVSRSKKSYKNYLTKSNLKEITEDFDAVIICTPNAYHQKYAIEGAELGKHVLTEKPLDISIDSMNKMIKKCKEV